VPVHEHVLESRVPSAGVELAVRELRSDADVATVVLVHGYPDTQGMWDPLARLLHDRHGLRVVTYDVRGAGASTAPQSRDGYLTERLVDDLVAVLDSVQRSPRAGAPPSRTPVHLVGHDWGSVQLWDAVTAASSDAGTAASPDPRLAGRIASFTSISGPSLDHVARFMRSRDLRTRLPQALRSWYVAAFQVPVLPELVFARLAGPLAQQLARAQGFGDGPHWGPTFSKDAANGLELYRANIPRRMRSPCTGRTDVPVLTIVPEHDSFLIPALFDDLPQYAPNGRRVDVDGGHWVVSQQPELVADLVADWMLEHTG
jgi:pimeloyl-ACP methyl ester carboxylesterase